MSAIGLAISLLHEALSRPDRIDMKKPEFEQALANLETKYKDLRPKLEDFFDRIEHVGTSMMERKVLEMDIEAWMNNHGFRPY